MPSSERNGFVSSDGQRLLPHGSTNGSIVAVTSGPAVSSSNQLGKLPRTAQEYHALPQTEVTGLTGHLPPPGYEMEMQDMRPGTSSSKSNGHLANGASNASSCSSSSATDRAASLSRASFVDAEHYPDLLDHHRSGPALAAAAAVPYHHHHLVKPPNSVSPSSGGSGSSDPQQQTRLLPQSTSVGTALHTLSPANLMLTPQQQAQYAHLIATSPFQRTGTLPLPHQHRSVSCDHGAGGGIPVGVVATSHGFHVAPLPHLMHHHHVHPHQQQQHQHQVTARPGYVTLPRRPRVGGGWSIASSSNRDTPSPGSASVASRLTATTTFTERDPIYDGIGPRTSADGSSRLCLTKPNKGANSAANTPGLPPGPLPGMVLPPQSTPTATQTLHRLPRPAPIAELQECAPATPDKKARNRSTPNILDSANPPPPSSDPPLLAASAAAPLIEENLRGDCEPCGKARGPGEDGDASSAGNRNSVASSADGMEETKKGDEKPSKQVILHTIKMQDLVMTDLPPFR